MADSLQNLRAQLLQRWDNFPLDQSTALDELLSESLCIAQTTKPEIITVMNPISRPQRLQLATLVSDKGLDTLYELEWAELAVSSLGHCYLIYRRRDGGDYAIKWSPATNLPATMASRLPECLAMAMLEDDDVEP